MANTLTQAGAAVTCTTQAGNVLGVSVADLQFVLFNNGSQVGSIQSYASGVPVTYDGITFTFTDAAGTVGTFVAQATAGAALGTNYAAQFGNIGPTTYAAFSVTAPVGPAAPTNVRQIAGPTGF